MKVFILTMLIFLSIQDTIIGVWISKEKDLKIECFKKNGKYFGRIIWFKDDNPNIKKYSENGIHKSKWIGYTVMEDFEFKNDYWEGSILELKSGKKYSAYIYKKDDELELKIYLLFIPIKSIIFEKYLSKI